MVEHCWWNSGTVKVEQWNSDGRTVTGNSGRVLVEHWNTVVEQWKSVAETLIVEE